MKKMTEILDEMRTAYFEKTGDIPDMASPLGKAMQAAASELLSLYVYSDFVLREAFPQTAEGQWLERHAALRNISRKPATCAKGTLTFTVSEPALDYQHVPKGTVCAMKDKPFVQFATDEDVTFGLGETAVTVATTALEPGADGNAPAGTVSVMVTPPVGVHAVINHEGFEGGCDAESDMALRRRLTDAYRLPQTGYSEASLREALLTLPNLRDCVVQLTEDGFRIYVIIVGDDNVMTLLPAIRKRLALFKVAPYSLQVYGATPRAFSLTVVAETERTDSDITAALEAAVREYCASVRLGEGLSLARINCIGSAVDGVRYCEASSPDAPEGVIYGSPDRFLQLDSLQVICHE